MQTEAEIGVVCLEAEEGQGLLASTRSQERGLEQIPSESEEATNSVNILILDIQPLEL